MLPPYEESALNWIRSVTHRELALAGKVTPSA